MFNSASNRDHVSRLRLVNPGAQAVTVRIEGADDNNARTEPIIHLAAGLALTATAQQIELGEAGA